MIIVSQNQAPTKTLAEKLQEARALSTFGVRHALGYPTPYKPKKS